MLSAIHAIDSAIRKGGIAAGLRVIEAQDPSASLSMRYDAVTDPIFASAKNWYRQRLGLAPVEM